MAAPILIIKGGLFAAKHWKKIVPAVLGIIMVVVFFPVFILKKLKIRLMRKFAIRILVMQKPFMLSMIRKGLG